MTKKIKLSKEEFEFLGGKVEIETEGKVFKKHILILPSRVTNCKKWKPLFNMLLECDEALGRDNSIDSNGKLDLTTLYHKVKGIYTDKKLKEERNARKIEERKENRESKKRLRETLKKWGFLDDPKWQKVLRSRCKPEVWYI